jgi:hypothetical protein
MSFDIAIPVSSLPPGEQQPLYIHAWDRALNYTPRTEIISYYPTSWTYGGIDHAINEESEFIASRSGATRTRSRG